jgi:hypothetical protein
MRTFLSRRVTVIVLAAVTAATLGACAPAADTSGPAAVVTQAVDLLARKDLDGLRGLACAGQEDMLKDQLGAAGMGDLLASGEQIFPGLDMQALVDAISVDVKELKPGEASIEGDTAEVPVSGTVTVTFDKAAMTPILKKVLEQQGTTMTDDQLSALLDSLEAYGADLPVDQTLQLVRENGAWKICQDSLPQASPG